MINVFSQEAITSVAVFSFGHQVAYKEGILRTRVQEEIFFLNDLMEKEFFWGDSITKNNCIDKMIDMEIFKRIKNSQTLQEHIIVLILFNNFLSLNKIG